MRKRKANIPKIKWINSKEEWLAEIEKIVHEKRYYFRSWNYKGLIGRVPPHLYPLRVKLSKYGFSTPADREVWRKLYEGGFTQDEIGIITGWGSSTIREGLHKLNIYGRKIKRTRRIRY